MLSSVNVTGEEPNRKLPRRVAPCCTISMQRRTSKFTFRTRAERIAFESGNIVQSAFVLTRH